MSGTYTNTKEIFEELAVRFLVNEKMDADWNWFDFVVVLMEIHWFYSDIKRAENKSLPKLGFDDFCKQFCKSVSCLNQYAPEVSKYVKKMQKAKGMHVAGIICIDKSRQNVLCVKSYNNKRYGFPKGKQEYAEAPIVTAAREACEELGIDVSNLIKSNQRIEFDLNTNHFNFFFIHNLSTDLEMSCSRRNEIEDIKWFPLTDLTENKNCFDDLTSHISEKLFAYLESNK